MAGTRSSARQAAQASSSPNSSQGKAASNSSAAGSKRKAEASASSKSKRGKKGNAKEQKTIEETMPDREDEDAVKDVEMKDATGSEKPAEEVVEKTENGASEDAQKGLKDREDAVSAREDAVKAKEAPKDEEGTSAANYKQNGEQRNKDASTMDETGKVEPEDGAQSEIEAATTTEEGAVQKSSERDESTPSSILEKGIIYFFFRGRVGIDEPSEVGDLARSYIVLRPLPHGAKLGEGAIGDAGNNRLLALPKKVLPKSPRDRFMIFVEKAKTSMDDIKDNHLTSSDYETKTAGARHTPAATPIAEGVYAITTTGRESHLAYILTIPSELSEVQEDIGLRERGSFITSVKNPQYSGPAGANLPQGPEYSKEILDEFRSLRWMPLQPKHLDYENAQFIVIGEEAGKLDKATEPQAKDQKHDKDTPLEEMEKLEHEDEIRVKHLKGDDSVFEDLGLSSREYPKVQTTW